MDAVDLCVAECASQLSGSKKEKKVGFIRQLAQLNSNQMEPAFSVCCFLNKTSKAAVFFIIFYFFSVLSGLVCLQTDLWRLLDPQ